MITTLVRCGQCNILGIVNIGLDQETMDLETMDLEKPAAMVHEIKGYHDYCGAGIP